MTADQLWNLALSILSGFILAWIGWIRKDWKDADRSRDDHIGRLQTQINEINLRMAGELPSREDYLEIRRDMESIRATLTEVRDMCIRMTAVREGR